MVYLTIPENKPLDDVFNELVNLWGGWEIMPGGDVNTKGVMGWIDLSEEPWIWLYSLNRFIYLREPGEGNRGFGFTCPLNKKVGLSGRGRTGRFCILPIELQ